MRNGLRMMPLVAAIAALTTVATVYAQGPGGGGGGGRRGGQGGNPLQLLQAEPIQKELKLTDDQKSSISKLNEEQRDMSREDRQAKAAETHQKIGEILQPEQRERFDEITLQVMGARALTRPEVADKLGLSEEQKDKLNELMPRGGMRGGPGSGGGGPPPGGEAGGAGGGQGGNFRAMREEMNSKAMEILTSEQRTQYEKMQGKKFDFDPAEMFRNGRGGGGRGGKAPDA